MRRIFYLLIVLVFLAGCKNNTRETYIEESTPPIFPDSQIDSTAQMIADSVIYTVFIKNPDTLDQWREYSLRYMQRKKFIDMIFREIYDGELTAYSYRDWIYGEKIIIPVDSVRKLEALKSRIGQMEFVERWFYSPKTQKFYKQVLEITLAYELYNANGEVRGYAPLFKVSFDATDNKRIAK